MSEMATQEEAKEATKVARQKALNAVLRIKPVELDDDELNLAAGLLMGLEVQEVEGGRMVSLFTKADGVVRFEPSKDWEHYGHLVSNRSFVTGSHAMRDDPDAPEKVTGHWYSAHSFYSGTESEGYDLRRVVLECAAKRLAHEVKYPPGA